MKRDTKGRGEGMAVQRWGRREGGRGEGKTTT